MTFLLVETSKLELLLKAESRVFHFLSRRGKESVEAFVEKSTAPFTDALATEPHLDTDVVVGIALGAGEYEPGTLCQGLGGLSPG